VPAIFLGGMNCGFGWRQRENQPTAAGVDGCESENIAEEGSIGLCVLTVYDDMGSEDHEN
jgi:hypothetical protein